MTQVCPMKLTVVPVELAEANEFVLIHHRHHKPVVGHRFSIGVVDADDLLRGVCIVGRPVARLAGAPRDVAEVTRLCTDGTYNASSMLYGAAARIAKNMGFQRLQTYTLPEEGGASLRASGWKEEGLAGGGQWVHTDGKPRRTDQPTGMKIRWAVEFDRRPVDLQLPDGRSLGAQETLWA